MDNIEQNKNNKYDNNNNNKSNIFFGNFYHLFRLLIAFINSKKMQ